MIVMEYAECGNLRKNLQNIVKDKWIIKLKKLQDIIGGLNIIHQQKLIHCDFHHGNILDQQYSLSISDLGLCKPMEYFESLKEMDKTASIISKILKKNSTQIFKGIAGKFGNKQQLISQNNCIYGVLPFIAPEVLRGKPYTMASDIYSFSMIMWEFTSGIPPFNDRAHDFYLALDICKDEHPEIIENTPQCYIDLMKKCWDKDPLKRPNSSEVKKIIDNWILIIKEKNEESKNIAIEFYKADKALEKKQTNISKTSDIIIDKFHSQAYHTSRLFNFTKKLNETLDQEFQVKVLITIIIFIKYNNEKF